MTASLDLGLESRFGGRGTIQGAVLGTSCLRRGTPSTHRDELLRPSRVDCYARIDCPRRWKAREGNIRDVMGGTRERKREGRGHVTKIQATKIFLHCISTFHSIRE